MVSGNGGGGVETRVCKYYVLRIHLYVRRCVEAGGRHHTTTIRGAHGEVQSGRHSSKNGGVGGPWRMRRRTRRGDRQTKSTAHHKQNRSRTLSVTPPTCVLLHLSQLVDVSVRSSLGVQLVDGRIVQWLAGQHFPGQKVVYARRLEKTARERNSTNMYSRIFFFPKESNSALSLRCVRNPGCKIVKECTANPLSKQSAHVILLIVRSVDVLHISTERG